jgi:hypothetical protein
MLRSSNSFLNFRNLRTQSFDLYLRFTEYSYLFIIWHNVCHILVLKRISRLSSRISKVEQMAKVFLM